MDVLADAIFVLLRFIRGESFRREAMNLLVAEAEKFIWDKDFKGYIHDVGGPTANFRAPSCDKQLTKGVCKQKQCLFPRPCKNLKGGS